MKYRVDCVSMAPSICRNMDGSHIGEVTTAQWFRTLWGAKRYAKMRVSECDRVFISKYKKHGTELIARVAEW